MKIVKKQNLVDFKTLKGGDVFTYNYVVYIKTSKFSGNANGNGNAVDLESGTVCAIEEYVVVEKEEAELFLK